MSNDATTYELWLRYKIKKPRKNVGKGNNYEWVRTTESELLGQISVINLGFATETRELSKFG